MNNSIGSENLTPFRDSLRSSQPDANAPAVDSYPPSCGEGEALYLGLKTVFHLTSTIHSLSIPSLTSTCFQGLQEVLQHCAMWCSGAVSLGVDVMKSWEELFSAVASSGEEALKAESLSTLCKFSLPNFKSTSSVLITNFHASSLTSLFTLVHIHSSCFTSSDWFVVLSTLEQLSYMPISSNKLSDDSYDVAIALSSALSLLSEFTCSLDDGSLKAFIDAIIKLKGVDVSDFAQSSNSGSQAGHRDAQNQGNNDNTFGLRLMNIAGKAINDLRGRGEVEATGKGRLHPGRMFGEDLRARAFARVGNGASGGVQRKLSFGIVVLLDVARVNFFRGASSRVRKTVLEYLSEVSKTSKTSSVREFAVEALASMIMSDLERTSVEGGGEGMNFANKAARTIGGVEDLFRTQNDGEGGLGVVEAKAEEFSNVDLLAPLMETITLASSPDSAEAGLVALQNILESQGQAMKEAWPLVIDTIGSCKGDSTAFKCLRFIVDDFVEIMDEDEMTYLLNCSSSFASSTADVNASLTAVGMIWTISDHFKSTRMWRVVFDLLIELSSDQRAEVRNCAVSTLFSCVVGNGRDFGDGEENGWVIIFEEVVIGLLKRVEGEFEVAKEGGKEDGGERGGKGFQVTVHHSRDSPRKQWAETYKICIQGLGRLLRQFSEYFKPLPWFGDVAKGVCSAGVSCLSSSETEVEVAGIELVLLVVEVCCRGGVNRVGSNLKSEMKVVNGALTQIGGGEGGD